MSSINPGRNEPSFLGSIKPAVSYLLGASALFLMNLPITIATQGNVTEFKPWEAGFNMGNRTGYDSGYRTGYDSGYGIGYDSGYDSGNNNGDARCSANMGHESNNYSLFGASILPIITLGIVIGAVAYKCLTKKAPVQKNPFDELLGSAEVIKLQIDCITKEISSGDLVVAKKNLNNIVKPIENLQKVCPKDEEAISFNCKKLKEAKGIIEKLRNSVSVEEKKKIIEELKNLKFKNGEKIFKCDGIEINKSGDFEKMTKQIQGDIIDFEQKQEQYCKLDKSCSTDLMVIPIIKESLSNGYKITKKNKDRALEYLEIIKEHMNEHIQMKKGMKNVEIQTEPEETDLGRLKEQNRVLKERLEAVQKQLTEWGNELVEKEAILAQVGRSSQGNGSTGGNFNQSDAVSGTRGIADDPRKDAEIKNTIERLDEPNKQLIIAYIGHINGGSQASQFKEQCYQAIARNKLPELLNNLAVQIKQANEQQSASSSSSGNYK